MLVWQIPAQVMQVSLQAAAAATVLGAHECPPWLMRPVLDSFRSMLTTSRAARPVITMNLNIKDTHQNSSTSTATQHNMQLCCCCAQTEVSCGMHGSNYVLLRRCCCAPGLLYSALIVAVK